MLVIIPTAGIGSRLDLSTKNMNKAMLQIGDLPVISKIIDSYPKSWQFIVIVGYKGDQISEYLKLVYPKQKIKIIRVKNYIGPQSGLTVTLRNSLKYIDKPFFFHANDTIFNDKNFYKDVKKDCMFLSNGISNTMKYATVEINKNFKKIYPKLNYLKKNHFNYTGVSFISNINLFKKLINGDKDNNGELAYFFKLNPKNISFKFVNHWFDIGSKETKEIAEKFFLTKSILPKNDQSIYFRNNKVYKMFTNSKITNDRFLRSKILLNFVPKILLKKKYFYVYNFQKGKIFSSINNKQKKFKDLLTWLNNNFWIEYKLSLSERRNFYLRCNSFYYEKTLSRINYLFEKNNLKDEKNLVNGQNLDKIDNLLQKIDWYKINKGIPVNFHGDLHFENILKFKNKYKLLDWREDFSGIKKYGDIYYDLAKINHGLIIDHNVISKSKYDINIDKKKIKFFFFQSKENKKCQKILYEFIKSKNLSVYKVKILTALIFLNIAGLHHYPYSIFLFYLGKFYLNNYINDYAK